MKVNAILIGLLLVCGLCRGQAAGTSPGVAN
jgi:hypothetical protein